MKIAVVGKGGVGKTTISALLIKILCEKGKVLAIDADPAGGLSISLGVEIKKTLEDVRNEIAEMIREKYDKVEIASSIDYKILEVLNEAEKFVFLAMGRPEDEGCYCQLNLMLRSAIEILSSSFDYVVIDGEAGVEQINRRVIRDVDALLVVTDATKKGFQVAKQIKSVADRSVKFKKCALVVNKVREPIKIENGDFDFIFTIPEDENILRLDVEGKSLLSIEDSISLGSMRDLVEKLLFRQ
ncbi:MAG: AAA family ATPase [Archaeoglobaceae archaeon]|nr:AAA family ATPase [Archaeoglobaceae archaeon]MDW8118161.1 AAA family ATPase [Archaeoglobaceae archaeon]